jgi:predicted peptidase
MLTLRIWPAGLAAVLLVATTAAQAQDYLTGMFRLTRQTTEIVEPDFAQALEQVIKKDEKLQWQLYVPENYDPARPAGLFVYIDPDGHGRIPDGWQPVFDRHNIIWVGVRQSKRDASPTRQTWQAILGARALEADYAIDFQRMYVGGTRETVPVAINTILTANEFSGAVYTRGSFYSPQLTPDHIQSLQRKAHVFITGTNDQAKQQIQSDYETYQRQGIASATLIFDTQRLGDVGSPEQMDEAFRFLASGAN